MGGCVGDQEVEYGTDEAASTERDVEVEPAPEIGRGWGC